MRMTYVFAALSLALLGCDKDDNLPPGPAGARGSQGARGPQGEQGPAGDAGAPGKDGAGVVSGTRIKAVSLITADGAQAFVGWHDAQFGADCAFTTASDGKTRCLPGVAASPSQVLFSDAACAKPFFVAEAGCAPPVDVQRTTTAACGGPTQTRVYHSGAILPSQPMPSYFLKSDGACGNYGGAVGDFYDLGTEVDPAMFAEGATAAAP